MNFIALPFARPWWLLALLPVALVIWRLWRAPDGSAAWSRIVDAHLLPHLLTDAAPRSRRIGLTALACGMCLAVLALAGPTLDRQPERALRRDALRVLAIELSPQMAPHLQRIKPLLLELLRTLPDGQTALLVYAEEPYLIVPPSTDAGTIARFIPELASDAMPLQGNRPERALRMAAELLRRNAAATRDLLWITTGATSAPRPDLPGARLSILHAAANDDPALAAQAQQSGGAYLRADDGDVHQLATILGTNANWIADGHATAGGADLGYWLVLALLPLAALAFRRGLLMLIGPLLCAGLLAPPTAEALELPLPAALADSQGRRLLEAGDPSAAAARFADRRWRAAASYRAGDYEQAAALLEGLQDADALYNRGNALAKQGRLADALQAYDASLEQRPNDPDTRHNRDLVQRLLNRSEQPPPTSTNTPPAPRPAPNRPKDVEQEAQREAARVAEQWLRRVPDEPAGLLRRKLQIEHRRRMAGQAERAW